MTSQALFYILIMFLACSRDPLIYAQTTSTEVGRPVPRTTDAIRTNATMYAWSSWGTWSPCSKTCGGGVAVQERHCLPRDPARLRRSRKRRKLVRSIDHTRRARNVIHGPGSSGPDCPGLARRYHECNTTPCPGPVRDARAEQCAVYDRRPFRGRFYTWVPYVDGDSPCTLNCRPRGQQFYASLALVVDGTPCTKPGFRAICVQGDCKAVGREGVLSSAWSRELRCGRRLVSGLFSRPRLPLGYSYVATVPRGACRLNVTEIVPNDNYIALKITNGSYIMNGEFAVSAPGSYEAAGARFHYARDGSRDAVFAHGPIHHPIDIMILYTQPNPSIKYEYFTESLPGEVESEAVTKTDLVGVTPATFPATHFRRHHSYEMHSRKSIGGPRQPEISINPEDANADEIIVGNRKFMWKIMSYTQCTRTCGGGIQLGKYRCVEANPSKREVASTHCAGPTPPPSRRKCGTNACPPRWRAAAWTACPRCGPATRTRIVGCVQDHAKGITKISDQKCPLPKPSTSESCVIPDCNVQVGGEVRQITSKRVIKPRDHTDAFKEGPVNTVIVNNTVQDVGPAYSFSASTAGWIYTDWSECVGWCVGGGVQTRGVRCGEASGCSSKAPESKRPCQPKSECAPIDGNWFTGEWSPCSSPCRGKQIRGVLCIGGTGRHLKDTACRMPKPAHERDCSGDCKAMWHYGDWGQCSGNCNTSSSGIQLRTAVCSRGDSITSDGECSQPRRATRICDLNCVVRPAAAAPKTIAVDIKPQQPLVIESQKASSAGTPQQRSISQRTKDHMTKGNCDDKLNNCFLAVQARLCNYNYYINNCCQSCAGR